MPEPRALKDLPEIPRASLKAELVSRKKLQLGDQFELKFSALVTVPDSVHGQFVVEGYIVKRTESIYTYKLGRSDRPVKVRIGQKGKVTEPGDYDVLCILAIRAIKDAQVQVLDVVELSFTVLAP